jgi:Bifunctional DNA primase/polymerase, N-terminal
MAFDIRSAGGMVVSPGSLHETGREYDWMKSPDQIRQLTPAAPGTVELSGPNERQIFVCRSWFVFRRMR